MDWLDGHASTTKESDKGRGNKGNGERGILYSLSGRLVDFTSLFIRNRGILTALRSPYLDAGAREVRLNILVHARIDS
jgi:hypothetical protein